jgi:hypothetical protein
MGQGFAGCVWERSVREFNVYKKICNLILAGLESDVKQNIFLDTQGVAGLLAFFLKENFLGKFPGFWAPNTFQASNIRILFKLYKSSS